VILVGDAKQLPPVYSNFTDQDKSDMQGLLKKYGSLTFDKAHAYKGFKELNLIKIRRTNDEKLIGLLNSVRE
jgi:superfamily I DNA and/or RNA helicase